MSRRCKPGIRARIICGNDARKIVVVVRRYFGEVVNDATWPQALFPWVVTSLGAPLHSVCLESGKAQPPSMTIVLDDSDLEPLRDDDEPERAEEPVDAGIRVRPLALPVGFAA